MPSSTTSKYIAYGLLIVMAAVLLSIIFRIDNIVYRPLLSHNEDATGHVLATIRSMNAAQPSTHYYLPLITLSQRPGDLGIDNFESASVASKNGNYFYISFQSLAFYLPKIILSTLDVDPSVLNIRIFSTLIGVVSVILIFFLVLELSVDTTIEVGARVFAAALVSIVFLFVSEHLWIFANVYWHHILLEPLLIASLLHLSRYLRLKSGGAAIALAIVVFFACLVEWAGFMLAGGLTLVGIFLLWRREAGSMTLFAIGVVSGHIALLLTIFHFSQVAGFEAYLQAVANRPRGHILRHQDIVELLILLLVMYGPLFLLGTVLYGLGRGSARTQPAAWRNRMLTVLFCAAAASGESVLLLRHVVWYPYGALPLTTLLFLLLIWFIFTHDLQRWATIAAVILFTGVSLVIYEWQNPRDLDKTYFARQFEGLDQIERHASRDEMVFANIPWPLGVQLVRADRNIATGRQVMAGYGVRTDASFDLDLESMRRFMKNHSKAEKGKMFIFTLPVTEPAGEPVDIWFPYTKSRIVHGSGIGSLFSTNEAERHSPVTFYRFGAIAAIISFDANTITDIAIRREFADSTVPMTSSALMDVKSSALLFDKILGHRPVACEPSIEQDFAQCRIVGASASTQ